MLCVTLRQGLQGTAWATRNPNVVSATEPRLLRKGPGACRNDRSKGAVREVWLLQLLTDMHMA